MTNEATGISSERHSTIDTTWFFPRLRYEYTKHGSTLISTTENTWSVTDYGDKRIFPHVSQGIRTDNLTGLSVKAFRGYHHADGQRAGLLIYSRRGIAMVENL